MPISFSLSRPFFLSSLPIFRLLSLFHSLSPLFHPSVQFFLSLSLTAAVRMVLHQSATLILYLAITATNSPLFYFELSKCCILYNFVSSSPAPPPLSLSLFDEFIVVLYFVKYYFTSKNSPVIVFHILHRTDSPFVVTIIMLLRTSLNPILI